MSNINTPDTGHPLNSPICLDIDEPDAGCGLRRFADLPSHSFLVLLDTWKMYQDLKDEREAIVASVKTLLKRQKGQGDAGGEEINGTFK
ncbi:hypothetical protein K435DRAFT_853996 [Dendrothele bispora CBS 962.96]|uniref:Uncharacterized protein n=1 Tax=Dendrothele bispora (strain CBS 962.96) TaxID=1314807 RepID=A0A4S8MGG9_DENBC|nr:hypothetical protein K435DRAFT_853996 [Dendrothele bispora CBS 962.96]